MDRAVSIKKSIGVLGARGTVGKTIVQYLKNKYHVIGAGRSLVSSNENEYSVDIHDAASLEAFFSSCAVVVNAVGPSYINSEKIINAANECGKPCVDLFGGATLEKKLKKKNINNVLNAGCVPGLSGIVLAYLAKKYEQGDKLSLIHGGLESGGLAALKDIILSSLDGYSMPNKIVQNGEIVEKIKFMDLKEHIDGFLAPIYKDAVLDQEGIKIYEKLGIDHLEQYHGYVDLRCKELISDGCLACANFQQLEETEKVFKRIQEQQDAIVGNRKFWFSMVGILNKKHETHKLVIKAEDSSFLSGIVAALAGEKLLNIGQTEKKTLWAFEYIEPEKVFAVLKENGIQIEHSIEQNDQELECGEI